MAEAEERLINIPNVIIHLQRVMAFNIMLVTMVFNNIILRCMLLGILFTSTQLHYISLLLGW